MLTIEECNKYLKHYDLTGSQVEEVRNALYCICEAVIADHINNHKKHGTANMLDIHQGLN